MNHLQGLLYFVGWRLVPRHCFSINNLILPNMENLNSPIIITMDIIVKNHRMVAATATRKAFVVIDAKNDDTNESIELVCNTKAFDAIAPSVAENPDAIFSVSFERRIQGITQYVDDNGMVLPHGASTNSVRNITASRRIFTKKDALTAAPQAAFNLASVMFAGMIAKTAPIPTE